MPLVSTRERTLHACDELAGFITAISYVKPRRSVFEVDLLSVKRKMKDKAFARSVNRQDIVDGGGRVGRAARRPLCIKSMQAKAEGLCIKGSL